MPYDSVPVRASGLSWRLMSCLLSVVASLATSLLAAPTAHAAAPEVRGTWLTTTNEDHIRTGANTATVMRDLRNIGLNAVYVETWKNGYTNFPSRVLKSVIGTTDRNPTIGASRDLVQETLIQAHRQGMNYYGWFEYGAMTEYIAAGGNPSNPLSTYMKNRGWLLQNQAGQYADGTNGGFAFMNVAVPQVRQFIIDMTLEAVNRYDFDGIQFDDHMAWPVNFGFDATTINLYTSQTGNPAPTSPTNSQFSAWRQQQVTSFADQLYAAVKTARPELVVSISPSITSFSTTQYNANWPQWESQGLFDEFAVQMYRDNISSFNSIVNAQVNPFKPDDLDKLVMGLRINPASSATPFADLQQMIQRSRTEGAAGHSLWYSAGARDLYGPQLTAFYDVAGAGHAPNPQFPLDWRPAPLVAVLSGTNPDDWTVEVAAAGRYRIVARLGTAANAPWSEIAAVELTAGTQQFAIPGAKQVELLVDRRSPTSFLGDFNGDLVVDGADLLLWQQGFASAVGVPSTGDANRDGRIDAQDLLAWKFNLGVTMAPPAPTAITTPEPAALILQAAAVGLIAQRRYRRSPTA